MADSTPDAVVSTSPDGVVSIERDGRTLSGLESDGADAKSLTAVLERTPAPSRPKPGPSSEPSTPGPAASPDPATSSTETDDGDDAGLSDAARTLAQGKTKKQLRQEFQARIDAITREKYREKDRAEQLAAELAALKHPAPSPTPDTDGRPRLRAFTSQVGTTYETHEDAVEAHTDALTDWKQAQRDEASAAQRVTHTIQTAQADTLTRGQKAYADFDAAIEAFVSTGRAYTPPMQQAILEDAEVGHALAYELATNPESYQSLATAPTATAFARRLVPILTRLAGAPSGSPAASVPFTPPPAPVQPVGSNGKTTTATLADLASRGGQDYDSSGYRERRQQERARRR